MSFGGFGSNNTNTNTGFGGFGNNNTTNTTSGGSLFGGNTATSGGFGGFGSNNAANNSPFGAAKPAFGAPAASTGGNLFGGSSTTGGFGGSAGFGANNNAGAGATLSTGFNTNANAGSLFGAKPATTGFGSTNTTGGSLFGSNTGGFGANNTTAPANPFGGASNTNANPFGASNSTAGGFGASNTNTTNTFGGFGGAAANNTTQGTAATPFTAFTEKDGTTANATSAYQSITMQQPYQGKSFEELRLEDYAQNRRLPQNNSFGSSNTFSTFGANNTTNNQNQARPGLFGASNTATGFGASNTSTGFGASNTGFGANNNTTTGGSLFGAKPAGTSLFGNTTASTNTTGGFGAGSNTGGGLFGNNANNTTNTSTGFGAGFGANNTNTGSSLFGNNNNANNQQKPAFGGFGASNTATSTTGFGGFGANNNTAGQTGGGLFGGGNTATTGGAASNVGSSLFGNNNNNQNKPAGTGLFGAPAANNNLGGGLFGSNNQQAAGAFGGTSGGTGLFGSNNQAGANTGGGLFGNNNQNKPAGTGLFGAAAPATGGGLFGAQNNNQSGGLFGGNNNAAGGSLFGNNQAKPAGGSLFGGNTGGSSLFGGNNNTASGGGGLFGGNNNATAGNSLFGGSQNQNTNSLFGNSQGQPQQNQLSATITGDPYGNAQLFSSLAAPSPPVGPLATPLNGAKAAPKARASLLASVRGGSPMLGASTSLTPRGRTGYGFSYSNYNTPTASTPVLTAGASSLLRTSGSLGSALNSRLSKSFSTSNLRADSGDGHSLVRTPGPGQGSLLLGSNSLGSGSVRRLKIDRSLRTNLFDETPKKQAEPSKEPEKEPELRKRVSFDRSAEKENSSTSAKPSAANALVVREDESSSTPEMSQISSTPLTSVPEESAVDKGPTPRKQVEPGEYFTEPPLKQIKNLSRGQLSHIKSFTVGRQGVGKIDFGRTGEVDLSTVTLDDICGKIVQLKPRSATVYEDDADKPPVGRGLNVPSTIYLEQSWPRASRHGNSAGQKTSQKDIDRHKARLRRVGGTKFLDYDDSTGIWSFTVEHFTTYELDNDEETTMHDATNVEDPTSASSGLSDAPHRSFDSDHDAYSPDLGEQDDTFQFKIAQRSQQGTLSLPGGFENSMPDTYDRDEASADEMQEDDFVQAGGDDEADIDPFIETAGAVQPPSPNTLAQYHQGMAEDDMDEEQDLPGSFHDPDVLKSILKPNTLTESLYGLPDDFADRPWEDQLQRTLSPRKRDRQALRDAQITNADKPITAPESILKRSLLSRSQLGQSYLAKKGAKKQMASEEQHTQAFTTSMDIMKSLWADEKQAFRPTKLSSQVYKSSSRANNAGTDIESTFHHSFKPSFSSNDVLVFASTDATRAQTSDTGVPYRPVTGDRRDINFCRVQPDPDLTSSALRDIQQKTENTVIQASDMEVDDDESREMPQALTSSKILFKDIAASVQHASESARHEKALWELCSVLFDPLEACAAEFIRGLDEATVDDLQSRIRRDAVLDMWKTHIKDSQAAQPQTAASAEHKALLLLCIGDVIAASEVLMKAKNTKLAVLVSQLPGNGYNRDMIKTQIKTWQERKDWTEFSQGQRALYSLLAGNTCLVPGIKGAAEDKVSSFCISEAFGLTWQHALALKLQYAGHDDLRKAVREFVSDISAGQEQVSTAPWHGQAADAEDTMLSLLKVNTEQATAEDILDPLVVCGDAFHNRLTWQLATLLGARGILQPSDDKMDALTVDLATEQESAGSYLDALWTTLHLNDNDSRFTAIKAILDRNSAKIPEPAEENDRGDFELLVEDLLIPVSLVWSAKALHAQSAQHDPIQQCQYLLAAATRESFEEAHTVVCREVGPTAVIEEQYDELYHLIQQFDDLGEVNFDDWATGGQVYLHLCQLLRLPSLKANGREAEALLKKLDRSLEAQKKAGPGGLTLEMRVAQIEMRKIVNERVKQMDDAEKWFSGAGNAVARSSEGSAMLERYMRALGEVH